MCMCSVVKGQVLKLDPKSRKYIFLGYEIGVKGYRLQDPNTKEKVINRDASLDEAFVLNHNEEDTTEDGHKQKLGIEVEFGENSSLTSMGYVDTNSQQQHQEQQDESYTIAKGR